VTSGKAPKQRSFVVTDAARAQLREIADGRQLGPGKYLRLALPPVWTGDGEFGIVIDDRGSGDETFSWDGRPCLLIERDVAIELSRSIMDFKETPAGMGFTVDVY
jgi:hypothetical protein